MKEKIIEYLIFSLLVLFFVSTIRKTEDVKYIYIEKGCDEIKKEKLIESFINVESSGNDSAINKSTKASGCLQIMPIMVREANRLSGSEKYSLNDRFSRDKSIEIFRLIMEHKNPEYDIERACIIWNPRGGYNYLLKIEKEYQNR